MSSTLESMTAIVRRLSCVVVPLFIVLDDPAQLLYTIPGTRQAWLPIVFAVAWMLTAASALSKYRRGSYVTWNSCTARPFRAACLLALNVAVWPAMGLLNGPSTSSLVQSATIPTWICGLGAAMATVVTASFLRF